MHPKYAIVAARANHACEYCYAPEIISNVAFEIDHIIPIAQGGSNQLDNLALSCRICNLRKSDHTDATDPISQTVVPLFNPRQHQWPDHFEKSSQPPHHIIGKTAIGRAAVIRLDFNSSLQLRARAFWVALDLFRLN
jgi:HNH endonuclease